MRLGVNYIIEHLYHNFPLDGEYLIKLSLAKLSFGQVFGSSAEGELLEVTMNGERAVVRRFARRHEDPAGLSGAVLAPGASGDGRARAVRCPGFVAGGAGAVPAAPKWI